jgi:hypothetical protein
MNIRPLLTTILFAFGCEQGGQSNSLDGSGKAEGDGTSSTTPSELVAYTQSDAQGFAGSWESVSDDGTKTETADLQLLDGNITGTLRSLERGYYSGRVKVTAEIALRGVSRDGGLDISAWDAETGSAEAAVSGRAMRRGDYLIVRIGDGETDYARPGETLVRSAEGSAEATSLANAIAGRIYSSSTQASGRGAFVGNRVKLALCGDGTIAFDVSDLASTGGADGVDMGDATSRRGQWNIVLLAGSPVVRANWAATGSSYSLTRYFRVVPAPGGSTAFVDGTELPVAGSC